MTRIYDLSLTLENFASSLAPEITYWSHEDGAKRLGRPLEIERTDLPDGLGFALEKLTLVSHSGTHMDAPYHYGPLTKGVPSLTIDQVPLEWCYGDGVVLNLIHKKPGDLINVEDVKSALDELKYTIMPGDIVLIRTDAYKRYGEYDFEWAGPGMSREATIWIHNQGVRVMGTDAFTFDRPFKVMVEEYKKKGQKEALWPAHFVAREIGYIHIEQLANLDKIPASFGFKFAAFPIKIAKGSGAWVRAVAIFED